MRAPALLAATALATLPALARAEVPQVMTDLPVVHSLVAQVMGDLGAPGLLLDRGGDPHAFQLRPSQARALSEADLLFWVGPELTPWLDRALEGTGIAGEAVSLLSAPGVQLLSYEEGHHEAEGHDDHAAGEKAAEAQGHGHEEHAHEEHGHEEHGHEEHGHEEHAGEAAPHDDHGHEDHGHAHEGADPHAWLDPANARAWVSDIALHLAEADPANAATYAANAEAARARLDALEAEVAATLAPVGDAPIYVFHDAYGYFEAAFGVNVAGTLALGDAAAPGAARLDAVRDELAAGGVACIFAEANHDAALVETVAEGTGIGTGVLDPEGVMPEPGPDHYAETLRALATSIAGCVGARG